MKKSILVIFIFIAFLLAGCSDDKKAAASEDLGTFTQENASQTVTASEGGTVETASASVVIPAGALSADTTITISNEDVKGQPDEAKLLSFVFDFGPEGTTFTTPVTIALKLSADIPDGKKVSIAYLNSGAWEKIGTDVNNLKKGDKVSAEVSHFSRYVIKIVDDAEVVETEDCKDFEFTKCGGDVVGKWYVKSVCGMDSFGSNSSDSTPEECKNGGQEYSFDINWDNSWIEFHSDGTFNTDMEPEMSNVTITFTDACLVAMASGQMAAADVCSNINNPERGTSCSYSSKCVCEYTETEVNDDDTGDTGTYTTSDGILTTTDDTPDEGENPTKQLEYCVSGNKVSVKFVETDEETKETKEMYYILEKQ